MQPQHDPIFQWEDERSQNHGLASTPSSPTPHAPTRASPASLQDPLEPPMGTVISSRLAPTPLHSPTLLHKLTTLGFLDLRLQTISSPPCLPDRPLPYACYLSPLLGHSPLSTHHSIVTLYFHRPRSRGLISLLSTRPPLLLGPPWHILLSLVLQETGASKLNWLFKSLIVYSSPAKFASSVPRIGFESSIDSKIQSQKEQDQTRGSVPPLPSSPNTVLYRSV